MARLSLFNSPFLLGFDELGYLPFAPSCPRAGGQLLWCKPDT